MQAYRSMRHYSRSLEALARPRRDDRASGRSLLARTAISRSTQTLMRRLAQPPHPDSGALHFDNQTDQRGGFSGVCPVVVRSIQAHAADYGAARRFRARTVPVPWNWLPEARSRCLIVVAPTAIGSTWSLMEPEIDSQNLGAILTRVRDRWNIDPGHMLLTGMSDGGTFTLLSGLADDSPFTHLAPVAASFHPFLLAMTSPDRLTGLPVHPTHGAEDWMFPVSMARTAHRTLAAAGAAVVYREIADLSHAYPRDGQGEVLDRWLASR